jgi:hypothetical protein
MAYFTEDEVNLYFEGGGWKVEGGGKRKTTLRVGMFPAQTVGGKKRKAEMKRRFPRMK